LLGHILDIRVLHNRPEKADELTGSGDDGDLRWFPTVDTVEKLEEAVLSLPGMSDDMGWLSSLAFLELSRESRSISILPSSLNEDVATSAVTGFGDVTLTNTIPAGVFGRNKAEKSHELGGSLKASPVADLGDEGHGGQRADAPETGEPLDERPVQGREGESLDLFVEVVASAGLVVE